MLSHYYKTLTQFTSAVVLALLGATACSDTTKDQTQAEQSQDEPQQTAQPAEFKCELPGWAVEHQADGSDRVTVFDLTLGDPLPEMPACPEMTPETTKVPCIYEIESWAHSTADPYLKYGTGGEASIWYPISWREKGYPNATMVGLDNKGAAIYFRFTTYSLEKRPAEILGEVTSKDQQCYLQMVNKILGDPVKYTIREQIEEDPYKDSVLKTPPGGVPQEMWMLAAYGAVIAVWDTEKIWAKYLGESDSRKGTGTIELGLKSMFANDKLPE